MTTIVKPTWSVDGWAGNTVNTDGVTWFVRADVGWFQPVGVRASSSDRPTQNGLYTGPNLRTARVITLSGFVQAPTTQLADDALDAFNAVCGDGGLHELVVEENHRTLRAMVRLGDGTNSERLTPRRSDWQLVLVAPDPRKYGPSRDLTTGLSTDVPGGVPWGGPAGTTGVPWGGPTGTTGVQWQSGPGASGIVTAVNDGNAETPIALFVTANSEAVTNPAVTVVATGEQVAYGGTVPAGSTLVIDTGTGSVLLDGAQRGALLTRADPIAIPKRSTRELLFTASGPAPSASLLVRVADAYM